MFCYVFKSFNVGITIKENKSQLQRISEERRLKGAKTHRRRIKEGTPAASRGHDPRRGHTPAAPARERRPASRPRPRGPCPRAYPRRGLLPAAPARELTRDAAPSPHGPTDLSQFLDRVSFLILSLETCPDFGSARPI